MTNSKGISFLASRRDGPVYLAGALSAGVIGYVGATMLISAALSMISVGRLSDPIGLSATPRLFLCQR